MGDVAEQEKKEIGQQSRTAQTACDAQNESPSASKIGGSMRRRRTTHID
jgi:hypothetical protein